MMLSFWSSPTGDMELLLWTLLVAAAIAIVVGILHRRVLTGVVVFSVLGNVVVWLTLGSRLYTFYEIEFIRPFARFLWPLINAILIIWWVWSIRKGRK